MQPKSKGRQVGKGSLHPKFAKNVKLTPTLKTISSPSYNKRFTLNTINRKAPQISPRTKRRKTELPEIKDPSFSHIRKLSSDKTTSRIQKDFKLQEQKLLTILTTQTLIDTARQSPSEKSNSLNRSKVMIDHSTG
jgi:hypothetical protein